MKTHSLLISATIPLCMMGLPSICLSSTSGEQAVEAILSEDKNISMLTSINSEIDSLLEDPSIIDQSTRNILTNAKDATNEMLIEKTAFKSLSLVNLAELIFSESKTRADIYDQEDSELTQAQKAFSNNILSKEGYFHSISTLLGGIYWSYLDIDKASCPPIILESHLQLYLKLPLSEYGQMYTPDYLLFYVPQWTQTRFMSLTAEQKRKFLKDVTDARADRASGLSADQEPEPPRDPADVAAYEAAYQFIVANTPPAP
jgi:hypothetical protein